MPYHAKHANIHYYYNIYIYIYIYIYTHTHTHTHTYVLFSYIFLRIVLMADTLGSFHRAGTGPARAGTISSPEVLASSSAGEDADSIWATKLFRIVG
jgi:hypothetical protein